VRGAVFARTTGFFLGKATGCFGAALVATFTDGLATGLAFGATLGFTGADCGGVIVTLISGSAAFSGTPETQQTTLLYNFLNMKNLRKLRHFGAQNNIYHFDNQCLTFTGNHVTIAL
jgi:hypothetical protein